MKLARWARPPVFVAGDAAHAMTPNLGQGANSAMVDALVLTRILARAIGGNISLEAAASEYESIRRAFATRIQSTSHQMGMIASWQSPMARAVRNVLLDLTQRFAPLRRRTALLGTGYNPPENSLLEPF
jgi:2-polyprenyl-6-methoxyphenol hydroxylase-like FAD-dependent oxidoreductase